MEHIPLMSVVLEQAADTELSRDHHVGLTNSSCNILSVWESLRARKTRWWELTTSSAYFSSSISRRDSAHWIWIGVAVLCLISDFSMGFIRSPGSQGFLDAFSLTTLCLDCILIGHTISLKRFSTRSLHFDISLTLGLVAYTIFFRMVHVSNNWCELFFLAVTCATGVHSSVQILFRFCTIGAALLLRQKMEFGLELLFGLFFCYLGGIVEYRSAMLLSQLHDKTLARERLLDQVTAGFCEIDVSTGMVTNASEKLESTLANNGWLRGSMFSSLLSTRDDKHAFDKLLINMSLYRDAESILVTCRLSEGKEFDARLIALPPNGSSMIICFQTLGELREVHEMPEPFSSSALSTGQTLPNKSFVVDASRLDVASTIYELDDAESGAASSVSKALGAAAPSLSSLAYSQSCAPIAENRYLHLDVHDIGIQTYEVGLCDSGVQTEASRLRPPLLPNMDSDIANCPSYRNYRTAQAPRKSPCHVILNSKHRPLRQFQATPKETLRMVLMDTMEKSNLHGKGCCYWHVSLMGLRQIVTELSARGCQMDFTPNGGWQCQECCMVHVDDDEPGEGVCDFCGAERDLDADESGISSTSKD